MDDLDEEIAELLGQYVPAQLTNGTDVLSIHHIPREWPEPPWRLVIDHEVTKDWWWPVGWVRP